ncbi:MAG: glycosyltransferase [Lentisphaerae bacterium]|nr:glycosyltransferase [Lentisphaerota bacterium]
MKPDISLIIPFFNEQENITRLVTQLNSYCASLQGVMIEVLFIDDGSSDHSLECLKTIEHTSYDARIIKFSQNYGSHAALRAGILHAKGAYTTFLSADLQDPITLIEKLYRKSLEGYDIVWAARKQVDVPFGEKVFSTLYSGLIRRFAVHTYPENGFDVVMFNEKVKAELNDDVEANSSLFLQILTLGFKSASISYDKQARTVGKSKWTFGKKVKLFIDSFVAFSYMPIRVVSLMGILLAGIGFLWATYVIMRTILFRDLNPGWPTLIAVLMMGFGLTNISLGIIAEYLWRTLAAVRKRKVFILDEIIDLPHCDRP